MVQPMVKIDDPFEVIIFDHCNHSKYGNIEQLEISILSHYRHTSHNVTIVVGLRWRFLVVIYVVSSWFSYRGFWWVFASLV